MTIIPQTRLNKKERIPKSYMSRIINLFMFYAKFNDYDN